MNLNAGDLLELQLQLWVAAIQTQTPQVKVALEWRQAFPIEDLISLQLLILHLGHTELPLEETIRSSQPPVLEYHLQNLLHNTVIQAHSFLIVSQLYLCQVMYQVVILALEI